MPADCPPVVRRDWILDGLGEGAPLDTPDPDRARAALAEPVVLAGDQPLMLQGGPVHLAGPPPARRDPGDAEARGRDRRLHGHHDARLEGPAARREVAGGRQPSRPTCRARRATRLLRSAQDPEAATGRGSAPCAARTSTTARWSPWTTGPATSSPTPAAPATTGTTSPAPSSRPSSTPPATAPGSRVRRSSRSCTRAPSTAGR